tara:strand:+ start:1522 stop:2124 length:603 start_codon:yes stop_codon:yes gene_type:complete
MMRFLLFIIILCFTNCQSKTEKLPILSYKINAEGKKETFTISYSGFTNQDDKNVSTETIKDKIVIANFFFTRCPSICPPMRMQLIDVAEEFLNEPSVLLISHSIDPKNDTTKVLKNYAKATEIPTSKWWFVRSNEENTKALATQFMTHFRPNEAGTDFYHSSYVALLDTDQKIRGFYNVLIPEEVERLINDVKLLIQMLS